MNANENFVFNENFGQALRANVDRIQTIIFHVFTSSPSVDVADPAAAAAETAFDEFY